jgi:hypothetical protein
MTKEYAGGKWDWVPPWAGGNLVKFVNFISNYLFEFRIRFPIKNQNRGEFLPNS